MTTLVGVIVIASALMLAVAPLQAAAAGAKETVEDQAHKMLKTLADPAFKDQPREAKIAKIRPIVNEIFDYAELSKRTLGREWAKFNAQQQAEFVKLFGDLLETAYADKFISYSNEKVVFERESALREDEAEVTSYVVTEDDKKIPLDYRLMRKDGNWRVYDVVIEGISLVMNYRDQFRDILAKNSPEEALKILRDRAAK